LSAQPCPPPHPDAQPTVGGGNLVPTTLEVSQHILGSSAASQVGCRFLPGLKGNVQLSRISTSVVTEWLGENNPAPESDPAFAMLTLSPKRMAAAVVYTDQLLRQSDNIDALLTSDFRQVLSQQLDYAILLGQGPAQNEPLGLWFNPDVNKPLIAGADVWSWEWYTSAEKEADDFVAGGLSFGAISSPSLKKIWQDLSKYAPGASGGSTIWESIPNKSTTPILGPDDAAAAGPWQLMTVGVFGPALDIVIDRYSLRATGRIRFVCNCWVDVACRLPEAFTISRRDVTPPVPPPRRTVVQNMRPPIVPRVPSPEPPPVSEVPEIRAQNSGPKPGKRN
jgi:Phage capsid family